jgi:hypothetical protein
MPDVYQKRPKVTCPKCKAAFVLDMKEIQAYRAWYERLQAGRRAYRRRSAAKGTP